MLSQGVADVVNIEVSKIVNDIFNQGGMKNLITGLKGLGFIALVFYFVPKIVAVYSGSEQITPKLFGPPLFYAALLLNWNTINTQLDRGLQSIQKEFQSATPRDSKSSAAYKKIMRQWGATPSAPGSSENQAAPPSTIDSWTDSFTLTKIKNWVGDIVSVINNPEILVLKIVMICTHIFNTIIVLLFNAFAYTWINLLRMGGILALALYFFPTFKSTFTNWLRAYISVYLWIPLGSIMIYVSDQIFLKIVNKVGSIELPFNASAPMGIDPESQMRMAFIVISALATTILKLVLLSKVPNIISYWLGGGNSGDMFSSAPAAAGMAVSATSTVATTAAGAALGGPAGAAAGLGSSLKG